MSAASGRRPVLATLSPEQVPLLGSVPALRGLTAGTGAALALAQSHTEQDVLQFYAALRAIRSGSLFDMAYSQAFASGFSLTAAELRRIGGIK